MAVPHFGNFPNSRGLTSFLPSFEQSMKDTLMPPPRIRKILFDAFGTLFSPRTPVHHQYATVANSFGLEMVDEESVKKGFKIAYRHWSSTHPMYGKLSKPPLHPTSWWSCLIKDTFIHAGVSAIGHPDLDRAHSAGLTRALIERFWSSEGYTLHSDVLPTLESLHILSLHPGQRESNLSPFPGVVSGSDPGCIKVLSSLGIIMNLGDEDLALDGKGGIKEEEIFTTWSTGKEKNDPEFWVQVLENLRDVDGNKGLRAEEVLVIGDELINDYLTPRKVGFRSLLLRRQELDGEHARMTYDDEVGKEAEVERIGSLEEVVDWLRSQE